MDITAPHAHTPIFKDSVKSSNWGGKEEKSSHWREKEEILSDVTTSSESSLEEEEEEAGTLVGNVPENIALVNKG